MPADGIPASDGGMDEGKDHGLDRLATIANVAQFVSFGPGPDLPQRYCRVVGYPANQPFESPRAAVEALLARSAGASVNVRSFSPREKGNEFVYGLTHPDDVLGHLHRLAGEGLHTIVNETIDVNDGGVSGVALGGVLEFAPGDTPRSVEKPGTVVLDRQRALRLLTTVYGFAPELPDDNRARVEFSLHPLRVGVRRAHTILWELEEVEPVALEGRLRWPNHFSRLLGDKVFGLLIADAYGLPVPAATVVSRALAPFRFGRSTGSGETWLRTCPAEPQPGKLPTQRGWTDPFALLDSIGSDAGYVASVLAQEGVDAHWSGATLPQAGGGTLVQGVAGFGDDFMLGKRPPEPLPAEVERVVTALSDRAEAALGAVRMEWVYDGSTVWVLQLHLTDDRAAGGTIYPGEPARWRAFHASEGLEALRELVRIVDRTPGHDEGILVHGEIGITSHVGDVLRKARIPARLAASTPPLGPSRS
jgi:hypothetical protein